jgi:hypothetical protein
MSEKEAAIQLVARRMRASFIRALIFLCSQVNQSAEEISFCHHLPDLRRVNASRKLELSPYCSGVASDWFGGSV